MSVLVGIRQSVKRRIQSTPLLYNASLEAFPHRRRFLIRNGTELVVEGFPRSGNTYAVAAIQYMQTKPIQIAGHTHAPAQVMTARKQNKPLVILIRRPKDAVVSLSLRYPNLSLLDGLTRYDWYHRHMEGLADFGVLATFEEITTGIDRVVERVNSKFGTDFSHRSLSKRDVDAVFGEVEAMELKDSGGLLRESHVARPSDHRQASRGKMEVLLKDARLKELLSACDRRYEALLNSNERIL